MAVRRVLSTVRASSRETSGEANEKRASQGRAAELDRLIHERVRLAILSALAASGPLTFSELKEIVGTTDGNLSVHARKLEDAKYIVCTKGFEGRTPKTEYSITAKGRRALEKYLDHMEALIRAARAAAKSK